VADQAKIGRIDGGSHDAVDRFRSMAQLNMLHSLAAKLNALGSVEAIGEAITAELRTIVEYHNCRVYLLQPDGRTLLPIAFRGERSSEYEGETLDELITTVGEGMTGHVAETGISLLTPNAQEVEFAVQIEGTDDIVESMVLVPTKLGDRVNGVIVLSSIGYGKFDEQDLQVVEVLAPHAAAAFDNAMLLAAEREAARTSAALLALSQALVGRHTVGDIFQEAIEAIPSLMPCAAVTCVTRRPATSAWRDSTSWNRSSLVAAWRSPTCRPPWLNPCSSETSSLSRSKLRLSRRCHARSGSCTRRVRCWPCRFVGVPTASGRSR
jgi:transcriptional regulator with GAF, ATPase, and Fis domain